MGDRAPTGADLVHPGLAVAAAVANAWLGREVLQGGVVVGPAGAVAVLGASGSGKSTVLASAMLAGYAVLADELVVVDDGRRALAGAATMAVRRDAARALSIEATHAARTLWAGTALCVPLGDAPASVPLVGWVELGWADRPEVRPLGPAARVATLGAHRRHGDLQSGGAGLMALVDLPGWAFVRPPDSNGRAAGDALLGQLLRGERP